MKASFRGPVRPSAFTMIEVLIVVVILGILAAMIIPRFTDATEDAGDSAVRRTLQILRDQIELYRAHNGNLDPDIMASPQWQILQSTEFILGIPRNPLNDRTDIGANVSTGPHGWIWRIGPSPGHLALYATDESGMAELAE